MQSKLCEYTLRGGLVGWNEALVIYEDGSFELSGKRKKKGQLPMQELETIKKIIKTTNVEDRKPSSTLMGKDVTHRCLTLVRNKKEEKIEINSLFDASNEIKDLQKKIEIMLMKL